MAIGTGVVSALQLTYYQCVPGIAKWQELAAVHSRGQRRAMASHFCRFRVANWYNKLNCHTLTVR